MDSSVDIKNLDIIIKKWGNAVLKLADTSGLMGEIGMFLGYSMLDRISSHEDVHGVLFEKYSTSYEELRKAKGLPIKVDLFFTGQLLGASTHGSKLPGALDYEATKDQVKLFFMNTPRKASDGSKKTTKVWGSGESKASNAEVAYYVNEVREFFGISAEEREKIASMVEDFISDIIIRKR